MVQKVIEEVADDADEVFDPLFGAQFKLTRQCVRPRNNSIRCSTGFNYDLQKRSKTSFKVDNMIGLADVILVGTNKGRCTKLGDLCGAHCFQGFCVKAS